MKRKNSRFQLNPACRGSLSCGGFVRGLERVMRERPSLRCQDLEGRFQVLRGWRHQTPEDCHNSQQEYGGGHEVEHAVDFEVCHQACTDQWAEYRAEPAHKNELSAYRHDPIGRHAIVRVGDTDGVQR